MPPKKPRFYTDNRDTKILVGNQRGTYYGARYFVWERRLFPVEKEQRMASIVIAAGDDLDNLKEVYGPLKPL